MSARQDKHTPDVVSPLAWIDEDLPPVCTRDQIADATHLHVRTIDRALARGELASIRVGRAVRIPRSAVREWLARGLDA